LNHRGVAREDSKRVPLEERGDPNRKKIPFPFLKNGLK